jgi:hypothetical protein
VRHLLPVAGGLLVVATSSYTLLTADQASLNFKFHVALLATVATAALLGTLRRRQT